MANRKPWIYLPEPLAKNILERLPLSDYVRFAAVCRRWYTIQMEHRHRYAPSSPPILPLPWILPLTHYSKLENPLSCFSPFERKFYRLHLTPSMCDIGTHRCYCLTCSHGWLLLIYYKETPLSDDPNQDTTLLLLLNPVSGLEIQLPSLPLMNTGSFFIGAMSSPPSGPDCVVMLADYVVCWLFRLGDSEWTTKLQLNKPPSKITYSQGKFYLTCSFDLVVVDPHRLTTTVHHVAMDRSQIRVGGDDMAAEISPLSRILESNGEILLVETVVHGEDTPNGRITELQVFKADLFEKKWVRVRSLGDRALFLSSNNSFCLSATNTGHKRNCIYFTNRFNVHSASSEQTLLLVFDLGTGRMTYEDIPNASTEYRILEFSDNPLCWFFPSRV